MSDTTVERTLKDLTTLPIEEKVVGVEVNMDPGREEALGYKIRAVYSELKAYRTPLESEWADNIQREESEFPKNAGPWPGSSDLRPPLTRIVKDTLHALYVDSLFGHNAKIRANPLKADDAAKAHKNEVFLSYQLDEEIDFYDVSDRAAADFLGPTGNAFLEPRYVVETEERKDRVKTEEPVEGSDPNDPQAKMRKRTRMETYEETIFDGVKVDLISSEFIHSAPIWENAKEAAERDVLIKIIPQSIEEIRRKMEGMQPKYHNQDAFEYLVSKKEPSLMQLARWKVDKMTTNYLRDRVQINTAEAYLWANIADTDDPDRKKMERVIVTLDIDSGVVFRVIKAKCRITHLKPFPIRGRFWGRSPHSIVKPLQKHLDAIVNQRVDAGTLANLPFMFYRAGGTFNPQNFSFMPAHGYPVENPGDIAWAPQPHVDPSFYNEEAKIWEYVERLFGLNENIQGIQSRKESTATEALEVSKRASVKFGAPFKRVVNQLRPLFYDIHELNQEFTPPEKTFRVLGRDGVPVFQKFTADEAKARLSFEYEVQTIYDEQLMRDTWLMTWRMFMPYPGIAMSPAHSYRLTEKAMRQLVGDTSAFLPVPEEAKLPSAEEAIELLLRGERLDPKPGIDPVHYLRVFAAFIDAPDFRELSNIQQKAIFGFFAKTKLMKEVFDEYGLNNFGVFPNPQGPGAAPQGLPNVNVGKQPSTKFNNMRVGGGRNGGQAGEMAAMSGKMAGGNGAGGPQPFGVR